jgi:uncharacterized membrane protein
MKHLPKWLMEKSSSIGKHKTECLILLFILAYTIVFSYYTILRHYSFGSGAYDLGIYENLLWRTLNYGDFLKSVPDPIGPTGYFFSVHFSPILFLLLPIYAVYQAPETLLIFQSFILALGAYPLFLLARRELKREAAGVVFAVAYLLYLPLHGVNWFDFHTQALLPVLFLFAFLYFKEEKWLKFFVCITLALMVNEVIPAIVIFFGLYGLWVNRKTWLNREFIQKLNVRALTMNKSVLYSAITVILGFSWFLLAIGVIRYFDQSGVQVGPWSDLFSNPIRALEAAINPADVKLSYILWTFGPLMFLSFLDPPSLFIAAPWFLAAFLAVYPNPYIAAVGYQYPAQILSFVFISAVYGAKYLVANSRILRFQLKIPHMPNRLSMILAAVLMVSIFSSVMLSPLGVANEKPQVTLRDKVLGDIINLIPSNASVSTQNELQPHLARRLNCYPYPKGDVEYVLVDTRSIWYKVQFPVWGFQKVETLPTFESSILDLIENKQGGLMAAFDGVFLYKKDYNGPILTNFTTHGLWAEFYATPRLFADGQWEVCGGANEEFNVAGSNGSVANFDSKGESVIQLRTRLQKGTYALSLRAMATNNVANDLRYGIWNSNDSKWVTSTAVTLSNGFKVYELKFNITEENENNDVYFAAMKEKNIPNEIYIDWVSIESQEPIGKTIVLDVNLDWGTLSPFPGLVTGEKYGVNFDGYLYTPQSGNYTFTLRSDDSSRLYIDDKLVIGSYWGPAILDESTTVYLEKGFHRLKIEYANFVDGGSISLFWKTPWSNEMEFIPNDYFYTEKTQ